MAVHSDGGRAGGPSDPDGLRRRPKPTEAPEPTEAPGSRADGKHRGSRGADAEAPRHQPAEGPYEDVDPSGQTVLWWHQHTRERQEGLNQMVDEFNDTNEWGIEVSAEYAGGYREIYDKMIAAIAADDPTLHAQPDGGLCQPGGQVPALRRPGGHGRVRGQPQVGPDRGRELPTFRRASLRPTSAPIFGDGHFRMGFPPNRSMEVLYYNQDWLNELGYDGPPDDLGRVQGDGLRRHRPRCRHGRLRDQHRRLALCQHGL